MRHARRDSGDVVVEFAAAFPVALIVILLCFEALMAATTVERVENAARTGARVASQAQNPGVCGSAAQQSMPGWLNEKTAQGGWADDGGLYCQVHAKVPLLWPGVPLEFTVDRRVQMPMG
jgi:Flp pilus assembly protein TadG